MVQPTDERDRDAEMPTTRTEIRDRRVPPRGVVPRHVQTWLMVAIALVILGIILLTGQPTPTPRSPSGARLAEPSLVSPERVRSYEQALAAEAARQELAAAAERSASGLKPTAGPIVPAVSDPVTDEQRRRDYQSLFADNIALSRRPTGAQPFGSRLPERPSLGSEPKTSLDLPLLQQLLEQRPPAPVRSSTPASPPVTPDRKVDLPPTAVAAPPADSPIASTAPMVTEAIRPGGSVARLLEGTVIETVLLNRLDGTFAGPVTCLVTTPVYSHDRQAVVIPAGARVLGSSSPVQTWGDSRLAVAFHRLLMPDGRTQSLDRFKGLSQIGDTGLKDSVNRHYWQVFGASLAIGALSGLAQYGSRTNVESYGFGEAYRQTAGSSLATSAGRVLDRYLNVLPTITIREGYRIKVYLTNDLELPIHARVHGGDR
jgi:type IV secretory pathway VirB10-like protein